MMLRKESYSLSAKITVPAGQSVYLIGVTDGADVHIEQEGFASSLGGLEIRLLEGITYTGGSPLTNRNKNTRSGIASTFNTIAGATVSSDGIELRLFAIPLSDSPSEKSTGEQGQVEEWKLKRNTAYALKLTNINNNELTVYGSFDWSEYVLL